METRNTNLVTALVGLSVVLALSTSAMAAVLYSEDFEAGANGDPITSSPYTWTASDGSSTVDVSNSTPLGSDLALDGSTTTDTGGNVLFYDDFDAEMPTGITSVLTVTAYGTTANHSSSIGISRSDTTSSEYVSVFLHESLGWYFNAKPVGGSSAAEQITDMTYFNKAVEISIYVDRTLNEVWASVSDGTNTETTNKYGIDEANPFSRVFIDNNMVSSEVGADWDDIVVQTIPEPATMGLLALGGLFALRRRR
jgi:hypothetical protein